MKKNKLRFLVLATFLSSCTAPSSQIENYGWHTTSTVNIQTGSRIERLYDDPLYYYHDEFDWLYLN